MRSLSPMRGVTLVDVLVGSALVLVVFLGLFAIIRASLAVSSLAKLRNTATAIATTRMEYVRSLAYGSVGTVGGIPAGVVPQFATSTIDGVEYVTRTFIEYADDPADGEGASDENGIITDYKHVKVSTVYTTNATERDVTLVSNFAPPGIETTTGGGTLRIEVVNSLGAPVAGASVRIVNDVLSPSVDVTTFSNANGIVYLPGAATSTQYEVEVTKAGYSTAETYARDAVNVNPTPGFLTVAESQTTVGTFAIDQLATLTIRTFSPVAPEITRDSFDDATGITSSSNTAVAGSALGLSGAPGSYPASGSAVSVSVAPEHLSVWTSASSTVTAPPGTSALLFIEDGNGNLISDTDLSGNSAGFSGEVDLSGVSTTTYPSLALRTTLTSSDVNQTPTLADWTLGYSAGPAPLPDVSFSLAGAKTIGSMTDGTPIYKTEIATSTNSSGTQVLELEWDLYQLVISGHTIISESTESPYELSPGASVEADIILTP
jgi:hypothetical protein